MPLRGDHARGSALKRRRDHGGRDEDISHEIYTTLSTRRPGLRQELGRGILRNDRAFRILVKDLTGKKPRTEKQTFQAVAALGTDTVESLPYHVVPGTSICYREALKVDADLPLRPDKASRRLGQRQCRSKR